MNGLRFKVGELAIYAVPWSPRCNPYVGQQCEVIKAGHVCVIEGVFVDYDLLFSDGIKIAAYDWQLRKLDPPAEPESITRREEVEA